MRRFTQPRALNLQKLPSGSVALRILSCLVLALAIAPTVARAEPITVSYDVQVLWRSVREGRLPTISDPFSQAFTLSMTFSPDADASGIYGRPIFSSVPLEVPQPPDGLALQSLGSTTHLALASGGFVAEAITALGGSTLIDGEFASTPSSCSSGAYC